MISSFLCGLMGGVLCVLATVRVRHLPWAFVRVVALLVFAMACGSVVWSIQQGQLDAGLLPRSTTILTIVVGGVAVVLAVMAPLAPRVPRAFAALCAMGGLAGLAAGSLAALTRAFVVPLESIALWLVVASQVFGALMLGSVTLAWLLGHAYLTATSMTIAPLRHFSRMFSWTVGVRFVFLVLSLAVAFSVSNGADEVLARLGGSWLIVFLRVGVGLVALAVFAYMVADCVKLRATQSATGILYFASIFAYIGELASQQLIADCRWPF